MRIELDNNITELAPAMAALQAFSASHALDEAASQAAELALDELLSNIIRHGRLDAGQHDIVMELAVEEGSLRIRISDGGIPFNPFDCPPPDLDLPLEEREPGGQGIHLVKNFMDEYDYEYRDRRNVVTLRKKLASNAP